jgi:hypothetical protein
MNHSLPKRTHGILIGIAAGVITSIAALVGLVYGPTQPIVITIFGELVDTTGVVNPTYPPASSQVGVVEVTREVVVTREVEVTRAVEVIHEVEIPREVEVTRIVNTIVEVTRQIVVTPTPLPEPTATPTPLHTAPQSILSVGEWWYEGERSLVVDDYDFYTSGHMRIYFRFNNMTGNILTFNVVDQDFVLTDNLGRRVVAYYARCGGNQQFILQAGSTVNCTARFNNVDYANTGVNEIIFSATLSVFQNARWRIPVHH